MSLKIAVSMVQFRPWHYPLSFEFDRDALTGRQLDVSMLVRKRVERSRVDYVVTLLFGDPVQLSCNC